MTFVKALPSFKLLSLTQGCQPQVTWTIKKKQNKTKTLPKITAVHIFVGYIQAQNQVPFFGKYT